MFDYLDYKNRIPLEDCLIEIPQLHPLSVKYEAFWIQTVKRKLIEGHWVSFTEIEGELNKSGDGSFYEKTEELWKWMPGPIFQYVNLWNIEMGEAEAGAQPEIGRPRLRDIEWIKGYVHSWALGFSGFKDDDEYTCNALLDSPDFEQKINSKFYRKVKPTLYNKKGELKKYLPVLPYLYRYSDKNLGKPLFLQPASNVVDIECRNIGKSMITGNFAGHNFITDGVKDYDVWYDEVYSVEEKDEKRKPKTDTLISAIDSKYVNGLISRIRTGLDNLPGGRQIGEVYYPAPMSKTTAGQWKAGEDVTAKVDINHGGKWISEGSFSRYIFRSFKDNIVAANSGRYGFAVIDEVGFMGNLLGAIGQLHETMTKNGWKYGCLWMTGTGGLMESGATEAVKKVFYSPKAFGCLEFDDVFENTGKKIGFFVSAEFALDEFRDELGNVDRARARIVLMKERMDAQAASSKDALNSLLQMKPLVPSEAFLLAGSNIFPVNDLIEHLKWLEQQPEGSMDGHKGWLVADEHGLYKWKEDVDNEIILQDFPVKKGKYSTDLTGGIQIWEMPRDDAQYGWIVGGLDPYNKNIAPESPSLGSFQLFRRANVEEGEDLDTQVAEYTGRPEDAIDFYETVRRMLIFYSAGRGASVVLHESNFNYIVAEFRQADSLHLLARKPNVLSKQSKGTENDWGFYMGNEDVKAEVEIVGADWLKKKGGVRENGSRKLQLQMLRSKPLIRELISYNDKGNFDRVIAFLLAVIQMKQMHKIIVESAKEAEIDPFFAIRPYENQYQEQGYDNYKF